MPSLAVDETEVGTPDSGRLCSRLFRATPQQGHQPANSSLESQPEGDRHLESDQPDPLDATKRRNTRHKYQSGTYVPLPEPHTMPVMDE